MLLFLFGSSGDHSVTVVVLVPQEITMLCLCLVPQVITVLLL